MINVTDYLPIKQIPPLVMTPQPIHFTPSRASILARIRAAAHQPVPHPVVRPHSPAGDPIENFSRALHSFDGRALRFPSRADALAWLRAELESRPEQPTVFSAVNDFAGTLGPADITDPHAAYLVDVCVAQGLYGVGETGSIWVTDRSLGLPAAALFSTDLFLLLDSARVLPGLDSAYRQIDIAATQYGAFYTGPSATADIEAVHVTGAQGEISLTALLY